MIKNPTEKDLKTLKMIIYLITNKITGQQYVGKTINTFYIRYKAGKWWKNCSNDFFNDSVKLYGHENFMVSILEYNIVSDIELKISEAKYIKELNTLAPNGYNYLKEDNSRAKHPFTSEKFAKEYIFKSPTGEIVKIKNLKKFCEKNNLDRYHMYKLAQGKRSNHKGWSRTSKQFGYVILEDINKKIYKLEIYRNSIANFCRKHKLNINNIYYLIHSRETEDCGWKVIERRLDVPDENIIVKQVRIRKIKSPTGEIFPIKDGELCEFARKHELNATHLGQVLLGNASHHNYWTLPETNIEFHDVLSPNDELFRIPKFLGEIKSFCNFHNLDFGNFYCMVIGKTRYHKGWRLEQNKHIKPKFLKYYFLRNINTGVIYTTDNLKEFCESYDLKIEEIARILSGKTITYKNWCSESTNIDDLWIWIKNPSGITFKVRTGTIKNFCDSNGLEVNCVRRVTQGKNKQHKGWTKAEPPIDYQI